MVQNEFYETVLQSLVHLNNRCLPDILQDIVSHGTHDPEEFPFLEEMHVLRRLQASHPRPALDRPTGPLINPFLHPTQKDL
jgi:hypothetical protein